MGGFYDHLTTERVIPLQTFQVDHLLILKEFQKDELEIGGILVGLPCCENRCVQVERAENPCCL